MFVQSVSLTLDQSEWQNPSVAQGPNPVQESEGEIVNRETVRELLWSDK